MKAKLVRIGNSRGVRLPKPVIEQAQLTDEVEVSVRDGAVLIRSAAHARAGWAEAAQAMQAEGATGAGPGRTAQLAGGDGGCQDGECGGEDERSKSAHAVAPGNGRENAAAPSRGAWSIRKDRGANKSLRGRKEG